MSVPPTDDDLARARTNLTQARAWTPSNDRDRRAKARNVAQLEALDQRLHRSQPRRPPRTEAPMSTFTSAWYWGQVPVYADPADLRAHFTEHHQPVDAAVLSAASNDDLAAWHHGEHKGRHPGKRDAPHSGHLTHTHPAYVPADAAADAEKVAA